ncbi:hypothetical protein AAKU55_001733 [Oxalobacteraceae bacterium GrIS 1.11]
MSICSQGHQSSDADYCSECGVRIGAPSLTAAAPAGDAICSDCGTPRVGGSRYCEVCRYDFQGKSSYATAPALATALAPTLPAAPVPAAAPIAAPIPAPAAAPFLAPPQWNVEIIVDPALAADAATAAQCPVGAAMRIFPLDLAENLVGRRSDVKGVYPEIPVDDPGVSRRHLKLNRQPDGAYAALDLGSTNGSIMNGATLEPGVSTLLKPGDEIIVGSWTKLRIAVKQ